MTTSLRILLPLSLLLVAGCDATTPLGGAPDAGTAEAGLIEESFLVTELLGRPTAGSIAVNVVPAEALEIYAEAGSSPGTYDRASATVSGTAGVPTALTIDGLAADKAYAYRLRWRRPGGGTFLAGPQRAFHTPRPPGATFRFTLQSDSHLDENSSLEQYRRTLGNVAADAADFHVDLGDTFMCEKHPAALTADTTPCADQAAVDARYLYERANFGIFAHSSPLFLANGNHEGELGYLFLGAGNDMATWATRARQRFYLNPTPDGFYDGDEAEEQLVGKRASWYSWQWGDALVVVLDPGWYTKSKAGADGWAWTLGERQTQWLERTLSTSKARHKLVFVHHLVGGLDGTMRGGIEAAPYYEWGGKNLDGTAGFAQHRPGWSKPIHQIFVDNKVTAVFHGHDHMYAKQDLDGVVYQEVPQPSAANSESGPALAKKFHYTSGTILSPSGHLRITVAPDRVTGEYVRAWLPAAETDSRKNGQVDDTWVAIPR